MGNQGTSWRHFDFWLLGAVAIFTIFGITMIRSAIAGNIDLAEHDQRQIIFAVIGFVVLLGFTYVDYHLWSSLSRPIYLGMMGILIVLYIIGTTLFGSARWFETQFFFIQPSEPAKIVIVLVLADFFSRNQDHIHELGWIFRSLIYTLGIVLWIVLQPNLSTSIVIMVIWFALLWASGLRIKHLLMFTGAGVALPFISFPFLEDYQQLRILNFLFPDPNARHGELYNLQQALISIGSGGWLGQGIRSRIASTAALFKDPPFRLHLFRDGRGVWLRRHRPGDRPAFLRDLPLPARGSYGARHLRRPDLLRRRHPDRFPGDG